ncbi:MAG: RNA methyltransferase [Myxococcota bacterium]
MAEADAGRRLREDVVFVLVRPLQSGNVGAVARAMKNMGLRRLAVVAPRAFDVDRARWMAPGAVELIDGARWCGTVAEAVADCHFVVATTARGRHQDWPAHDPEGFAAASLERAGATAVLFGPEDSGLAAEDLLHAHALLHIPTDEHASLNLAQAALLVGQALFAEARRRGHLPRPEGTGRRGGPARGAPPGPTEPRVPAPAGALDPLVAEWLETLTMANYFRGKNPPLSEVTLRRIFARAELDAKEISVLRGMLKNIRWRFRNPGA